MENAIIVPFNLNTAKKINIGEIAGRIVTEKGRNRAEIVYEDNLSVIGCNSFYFCIGRLVFCYRKSI